MESADRKSTTSSGEMMRAVELVRDPSRRAGSLSVVARPKPEPGPRDLLIAIEACGVCRTDLHLLDGELPSPCPRIIPGHQVVGRIAALGAECRLFHAGERVGVAWLHSTCGICSDCRSGRENLCRESRYTGYHVDGGYAELIVAPEEFVYRLPQELAAETVAPLLCAGIIGYRAYRRAALPPGGTVLLFGFGSAAHLVLQLARAEGHHVWVATRGERRRALAAELGAEWIGGTFDAPPGAVDSALIFAPAGEIIPHALRSVRAGGTVVSADIHMSTIPAMEYEPCIFHEKTLTSVESNTRRDGLELLSLAARYGIRPRVKTFGLEQAADALTALRNDGFEGSAVLLPGVLSKRDVG